MTGVQTCALPIYLGDRAQENFVSEQDAAFYAKLYQKNSLKGGHIILADKFAFAKRSGAMKAPVGLLSDRTVLRQQDGGASP